MAAIARLTHIHHSGFALEMPQATLVFDLYHDPTGCLPAILDRAARIYYFVSHGHQDHLNREAVMAVDSRWTVEHYVMSNECRHKMRHMLKTHPLRATYIHHHERWTDGVIDVTTFASTDKGVAYLLQVGGSRIFHAGDYNLWQWPGIGPAQLRKQVGDFRATLRDIVAATSAIDLAMFPVDPAMGDDFGRGARELLTAVDVVHFVPMHYWDRPAEAAQFEKYRNPNRGQYHFLADGESIELEI